MDVKVAERLHSRAKPNHFAMPENQEFVSLIDVVEVMGNGDHGRSSLCLVRQEHHDPSFGGRIKAGCGLINHEQAGIGK